MGIIYIYKYVYKHSLDTHEMRTFFLAVPMSIVVPLFWKNDNHSSNHSTTDMSVTPSVDALSAVN